MINMINSFNLPLKRNSAILLWRPPPLKFGLSLFMCWPHGTRGARISIHSQMSWVAQSTSNTNQLASWNTCRTSLNKTVCINWSRFLKKPCIQFVSFYKSVDIPSVSCIQITYKLTIKRAMWYNKAWYVLRFWIVKRVSERERERVRGRVRGRVWESVRVRACVQLCV